VLSHFRLLFNEAELKKVSSLLSNLALSKVAMLPHEMPAKIADPLNVTSSHSRVLPIEAALNSTCLCISLKVAPDKMALPSI
jgi:hypothetical protein